MYIIMRAHRRWLHFNNVQRSMNNVRWKQLVYNEQCGSIIISWLFVSMPSWPNKCTCIVARGAKVSHSFTYTVCYAIHTTGSVDPWTMTATHFPYSTYVYQGHMYVFVGRRVSLSIKPIRLSFTTSEIIF